MINIFAFLPLIALPSLGSALIGGAALLVGGCMLYDRLAKSTKDVFDSAAKPAESAAKISKNAAIGAALGCGVWLANKFLK